MDLHHLPLTPDLTDACVALWNRSLGDRFPMRPALLAQALWAEPNFDPAASPAVFAGDRLVAMIAVKRQQVALGTSTPAGQSWIAALLVDPDYQGRGIGSGLLDGALSYLRARAGDQPVGVGGDPGHLFPGIPHECRQALDWFARKGVQLGGTICDLANADVARFMPPQAGNDPDIRYRPARATDYDALLAFMRAEFPTRWTYEIEQHIALGGRPQDVMLALEGERVVGFARIHCPESLRHGPGTYWAPLFPGRHGGLGPIGVSESVRGRGLGLGLLSAGIGELRDRGMQSAVIDWTTLVTFYALVGFRPWKWYTTAQFPPTQA